MPASYWCQNEGRRQAVQDSTELNGIDFLEVSDDQLTLDVHFLHNLPGGGGANPIPSSPALDKEEQIVIEGGVRITGLQVLSATPTQDILRVTVSAPGDFSTYTLRLRQS